MEAGIKEGMIENIGSNDKCLCKVKSEDASKKPTVHFSVTLSNDGENQESSNCFPRLGIRTATTTPIHVCPWQLPSGADLSGSIQLYSNEEMLIGIDNKYMTTYRASVQITSDHELTIRCVPDDEAAIMSGQMNLAEDGSMDGGSGSSIDPNDNSVAVGVGVGIGLGVPLLLGALLVIYLYRRKKQNAEKGKPDKSEEEGDKNPGFEKDSMHSAPGVTANDEKPKKAPVPQFTAQPNMNPMPNNNAQNGMGGKQSSVGNLSQASSVSSVGVPDMGAGVIHTAGVPVPPQVAGDNNYHPQQQPPHSESERSTPQQNRTAPVRYMPPGGIAVLPMQQQYQDGHDDYTHQGYQQQPPMHAPMAAEPAPMPHVVGYNNPDAVHTEI
jgi:hypothetical protein